MLAKLAAALEEAAEQKQQTRLATLRLVNAAIRDRLSTFAGAGDEDGDATDETTLNAELQALLARMVAQREESARVYEEGGRLEMAEREREEIAVIHEFMPAPMTEDETDVAITEAISELGADGIRDISKVMAELKRRHAGRMKFTEACVKVRAALCRRVGAEAS